MVDPLEKLKLTEGGGRRGEKGYSDSREQGCVVTIKQAGSEGTVEGGQTRQTRDRNRVLGRLASSGLHQAGSKKAKDHPSPSVLA